MNLVLVAPFVSIVVFVSVMLFVPFVPFVSVGCFVCLVIFRSPVTVHGINGLKANKKCVVDGSPGPSENAAHGKGQLIMMGETGIRHSVTEHQRVT